MEIHYTDNVTAVRPRPSLSRRIIQLTLAGVGGLLLLAGGAAVYGYTLIQPPENFPQNEYIEIEEGSSINEIAAKLKGAGLIRSESVFYGVLVLFYDPTNIKASTYRFNEPLSVFALAERLSEGDFGVALKRFVHYEGERTRDVARRAEEVLEGFDAERFIALAANDQGKLFPDTYLLPEHFTAEELHTLMLENYESRIGQLRPAIEASPFTEHEVLTLASILEREANSRESMRIVSGILQDRLKIGMPLQVDAVFEFIHDKPGTELTKEDLQVDSPYNTYINPGLPPGPIGNPGLTAIEAVLRPEPSPYLYYLTAPDGTFYYATTYDQHQDNINAYLR